MGEVLSCEFVMSRREEMRIRRQESRIKREEGTAEAQRSQRDAELGLMRWIDE
jgi:hypothetical protein